MYAYTVYSIYCILYYKTLPAQDAEGQGHLGYWYIVAGCRYILIEHKGKFC